MTVTQLYEEAKTQAEWLTETRRALHRIPETGFQEFKTQALIKSKLDELGIPYETERTWIVGHINTGKPGPTVALRADIDALPVEEPADCPFRSEHEGWMHACGHDGHTTVLLGAAKLLQAHKEELRGEVRLLFQPAEETDGGALPMIQAGVMKGVDAVYGLHVQPYINVGTIDSEYGTLNASTDEIYITVHGESGHAARPHLCKDAIVCAAQMITTLQTLVSRNVSPLESCVLTFGVINGGKAGNIICDDVSLTGTLRTLTPEMRTFAKQRIHEICEGVATAMGMSVTVDIKEGYCALINTNSEVDRIMRVAKDLLGEDHALIRSEPSMGGEDFAYFCREVPGAFYHLGCATEQPAAPLHSKDFHLDERCLPIGAALQCAIVMDRINEE